MNDRDYQQHIEQLPEYERMQIEQQMAQIFELKEQDFVPYEPSDYAPTDNIDELPF